MISLKLNKKSLVIVPVAAGLLGAGILLGYANYPRIADGWDPGGAKTAQEISRGESPGEHGPGGERGVRGESGGSGSEEASGAILAPNDTFDAVRSGARLFLYYDPGNNCLRGHRGEHHRQRPQPGQDRSAPLQRNGAGAHHPRLTWTPGQVMMVKLPATPEAFTGWIAHAEVGGGGEGSQAGGEGIGEHGGSGGESPGEGGNNESAQEAAMSSPITPLDQPWNGVLGGLAVSARYDAATQSVSATVQNTLSQTQCYVQVEPHLKSGTRTVDELGPDALGDLNPGQQAISTLSVAGEPQPGRSGLRRVRGAPGGVRLRRSRSRAPHGRGRRRGQRWRGPTVPAVKVPAAKAERPAARRSAAPAWPSMRSSMLSTAAPASPLNYDAAGNFFVGAVENTTGNVLNQVRVEVHLSNGTELGPTNPVDLAPGQVLEITPPPQPRHPSPIGLPTPRSAATLRGTQVGGEGVGEHGTGPVAGGEHGAGGEQRSGG